MHRAGGKWLLTVCALWLAGVACGKPPVESELTVTFEQPLDGQRLAAGEDQDAQAEGFQYEVVAVAADTSGREVTLAGAKLELRTGEGASWEEGPAALLEGSRARFPGVTLRGRTQVLRVSVEEEGSRRKATRNLSVTVGAEVASLELVSPAEGQVLREADDADPLLPGYQVDFALRATGLRGASGLISCAGVCGIAPVSFTVGEEGEAHARVTLSEPVRVARPSQCVAVVKRPGGDVTSPARGVTLDTEGPRLALSSPVSAVASTTFKVEAVVRSAEDGTVATLSRAGAAPLTAPVRAGLVTFPEVSVPADGTHDFQLSLTDSGGNVTEESLSVVVASTAPSLSLTVPATVTSAASGQPAQAEAVVTVNGLPVGTEVELWTTVTGRLGQPQRARTEESGAERVARFPLSLAEGANTVKACVRNAAGTQACQLATTQVQTGRPSCRIVEPSPGDVLPAGSGPVTVRLEALDNNGPVNLSAQGPARSEGATGTASGGAASLSLALAGDGAWKLVASCAGGGVSQALTVYRDTTVPALSLSVRDAPEGRIGPSFIDTSSLPGTQVVLDVVTEPFARVLLQGCGLPATLSAAADGLGRATLRDVSVPGSGSCSFSAQAVDLAGNEATVQVPVVSAFGASSLSFTSPDSSRTLGPADGTLVEG
ncbi:MAG TPA: VCBS repeat-containing protein, partial [Myxococcaceae bacterium]|nr:VCBS repeat-containing protein [Myxococcaceae bacterium]